MPSARTRQASVHLGWRLGTRRANARFSLGLSLTEESGWAVDWHRLGRRAFIACALAVGAVQLYYSATVTNTGLTFTGARRMPAGRSGKATRRTRHQ
jgi:hypothetical protein